MIQSYSIGPCFECKAVSGGFHIYCGYCNDFLCEGCIDKHMKKHKKENKTKLFMFRLGLAQFSYLKLKSKSLGVKVARFIRDRVFQMGWEKEHDLLKNSDKQTKK